MSQTAIKGLGIKRVQTANLHMANEPGWRRIQPADNEFAAVSELNSADLAQMPIILSDAQAQDLRNIIDNNLATPRGRIVSLPTRD